MVVTLQMVEKVLWLPQWLILIPCSGVCVITVVGQGHIHFMPSGEGTSTQTPGCSDVSSPSHSDHPRLSPPAQGRSGPQMRGRISRQGVVRCNCHEDLLQLEKEKLVVLRGIEAQLERSNNLQQEMLNLKRAKLDLQLRHVALAEAQFERPSTYICAHNSAISR